MEVFNYLNSVGAEPWDWTHWIMGGGMVAIIGVLLYFLLRR